MRSHLLGALRPVVLLFSLLLAFVLPPPAAAQEPAVLRVLVTASNGAPLRGAQVVVEGTGVGGITDDEGVALIRDLSPGARTVRVSYLGYEPGETTIQLLPHQTAVTRFALPVRPVALAAIAVTTNRSRVLEATGFYERKGYGLGSFLTREQIERRRPRSVSDLLRLTAGVRLSESRFGDYSASMARSTGTRCDVQYYLDGVPAPMLNIDAMRPTDVEGIEVYRGPSQVPPRFRGRGGMCGVIVIWTRIS